MHQCGLLSMLFTSYFLVTMNRRALQYAIPMVVKEGWINKTDIGLILSMQTSGYTISKFITGIAVDHYDSRLLLILCVFFSSIITSLLAFSRRVWLSCVLGACSGLLLGISWPCIGKILRVRIPSSNFGFCWVLISCSMNVACMLGPMFTTFIGQHFHWATSMIIIASTAFAFGIGLSFFFFSTSFSVLTSGPTGTNKESGRLSLWTIAFNPVMLALSFGYFGISILRYTAADWIPLFLIRERGFSEVLASGFMSVLETGGVVGSFLAIRVSDAYLRKKTACRNPRLPCILILTMIACNATYILAKHADPNAKLLMTFAAFFLGISIYGPCSLYGVAAIEANPKEVSGSSHTIVAFAANIGAIMAGYPVSAVSQMFGWAATLYLVILLLSISGIVLFFARNFAPLAPAPKSE